MIIIIKIIDIKIKYIYNYNPKDELSFSYGILEQIYEDKKYNFNHKCSTEGGSSDSPILNRNNKIIAYIKKALINIIKILF